MNEIRHGDCVEVMGQLQAASVDLVVTSPPYDDLRAYNGYSFDAEAVLAGLLRVVKPGGVVVWVVGDRIKDGDRSLTSFKHAFWARDAGFKCHDLMIYQKVNTPYPRGNAYTQAHELMFVFSKGRPKTFNPLLRKSTGGRSGWKVAPEGTMVRRTNVWKQACGSDKRHGKATGKHPAIMPEQLAADHILSWSNEGDVVLDPMVGSGTTCVAAKRLGRNYIGIDISEEYCGIARRRIEEMLT